MLSKKRSAIILMILPLFVLTACGGMGGGGGCDLADFVAPSNTSPAAGDIVLEYEPMFVWAYSGDCEPPGGWQAEVTTYGGYDFGVTQTNTALPAVVFTVFDMPLQPATQYEWRAAARTEAGELGPYSMSTSFWTGPICETAALNAPVQFTPDDGAIVDNEFPPMGWNYPDGCIPELTLLQLDTDPAFPGPNLIAAGGIGSPRIGQIPEAALLDCTQYYWRVRSENPDGVGPWSPVRMFYTDFLGGCPAPVLAVCDTADLIAPVNDFPAAGDIGLELEPLFDWHYPDDCTPEGYRIDVTTFGGYDFGETYSGGTGNPNTEWFVGEPLQPATQYEWRAAGINGTTLGPYSTSTSFWTGPICETASLIAPIQNTPVDDSRVNNPFPPMGWSYPGACIPSLTLLELDVDPSFPGPNLVAGLGGPRIGQIPLAALADCTEYHWRVRSENPDGAGPYSPTWSFLTDFTGACSAGPPPSGAPMASAPQNLNCRAGDSTAYEVTGFFLQGESAEIVGRNQQGDWIVIPKKTNGGNCWVSTGLVNLDPLVNLNELSVIIPPPLPEPTATPTQLPIANPFAVTSVSVTVDDDDFSGSCPHRFTFTATIEVNGAGTVDYKWLRNDGATAPPQTLVFTSAGSQQVTSTWDLGASGQNYDDFWKQIEIIAPNSVLSNQAYFSLSCK